MKNILLLIIFTGLSITGFTQRSVGGHVAAAIGNPHYGIATGRTSSIGSIDTLRNMPDSVTAALYFAGLFDSGYTAGMNAYGDIGFAERYDFEGADSLLQVTGVMALFGGVVNPLSSKTITFFISGVGPVETIRPSYTESGLPGGVLTSGTQSITLLGLPNISSGTDSWTVYNFTSPTSYLISSFFTGYTMSYNFYTLAGDTIAIKSSWDNDRTSPIYNITGDSAAYDTSVNNQNVAQFSNGLWYDYATQDFGLSVNFFLFPIVQVSTGDPEKVKGITSKNLTFFGNYPNPANDVTNVTFSLNQSADVTLTVTDMGGHVLNTIYKPGLSAGANTLSIETAAMAAGNYLYVISNSAGGGMASKLTVVH